MRYFPFTHEPDTQVENEQLARLVVAEAGWKYMRVLVNLRLRLWEIQRSDSIQRN